MTIYENGIPESTSPKETLAWQIVNMRCAQRLAEGYMPVPYFVRRGLVDELLADPDFDPSDYLDLRDESERTET